jgi:hypothetical protein
MRTHRDANMSIHKTTHIRIHNDANMSFHKDRQSPPLIGATRGGRVSLPGSHRVSLLHARTGTRSGRAVHNQPVTSAPGAAPRGTHPSGGQRTTPPRGPLGLRDFSQHPHNRAAQLIDTLARARRYRVPDPPPAPSPRSWHCAIRSSRRCLPTSVPHTRGDGPRPAPASTQPQVDLTTASHGLVKRRNVGRQRGYAFVFGLMTRVGGQRCRM